MNANGTSLIKTLTLVVALYACTEDAENKLQLEDRHEVKMGDVSVENSSSARASSPFHQGVGAPIPLTDAERWIKNYRVKYRDAIRSRFFGKSSFDRIFNNPEAVGISITYAIDDKGIPVLLLVGVSGEGKVLAQSATNAVAGTIVSSYEDRSNPCPSVCVPGDDEI